MKQNLYLTPFTQINSQWVKNLNVRAETTKLPGKYMGNHCKKIHLGKDFMNKTTETQTIKAKMDTWNYNKPRCFFPAKETLH